MVTNKERVIERFIECGDPHHGFARIYCDACGHDYLLAYSCKTGYFCPSCHQKRVLLYGDWVEANVLAPVPHRQYVFTVPKLLRPAFGRQRAVLEFLVRHDAISGELRAKLLGWRHSGFSVHNQVRLGEEDAEGRKKLAGYMLRAPMSLEKVRYVGWYSNRARGERAV